MKNAITRILLLSLILMCIGVLPSTSTQAKTNWKEKYLSFLIKNNSKIYHVEMGYVNNDNIPELIYNLEDEYGTYASPVTPVRIVTIYKGKLKTFKALSNRNYGQLYYYNKSGIIRTGDYQHGVAWTQYYKFTKSWKRKKLLYTATENDSKYIINGKYVSKKKHNKVVKNTEKKYKKKYGKIRLLPKNNMSELYAWSFRNITSEAKTNKKYKEKAQAEIQTFLEKKSYQSDSIFSSYVYGNADDPIEYSIKDINADGLMELVICADSLRFVYVYDVSSGKVKNAGMYYLYSLTSFNTGVYKENGLGTEDGCDESYAYYTISKGKAFQIAAKIVDYNGNVYYWVGEKSVSEKSFKKYEKKFTKGEAGTDII